MSIDISMQEYLKFRNNSGNAENPAIFAFHYMVTNNYEFIFIHSNPKESYGYQRHTLELYNSLERFYAELGNTQYKQDLYSILTFIAVSDRMAPVFCTKGLVEIIENIFVNLYNSMGYMQIELPVAKDISGNIYMMKLLLEHMTSTFINSDRFTKLFEVLAAMHIDVKSLLLSWRNITTKPFQDSVDLLIKAYKY